MNIGVIVAAGRGQRFGGPIPKQYRDLDEQPVIRHTAAALLHHPGIDAVQVLIHPADRRLYERATDGLSLLPPLIGGSSRQETVHLGLEGIAALDPAKVLVHDAVRPLVEQATITAVLDALDTEPCAIAALAVSDTLKRCDERRVSGTVNRASLWRAQTPQGFRFKDILAAHRTAHLRDPLRLELTDDAMVAEQAGLPIVVVLGTEDNLKITTEIDLLRAEVILQRGRRETHTGWGFDSQTTLPGDYAMLCGISVAPPAGITTMQPTDVALNAVASAMLGTVGGMHKDAPMRSSLNRQPLTRSESLVRDVVSVVAMAGGRIEHIDLTLISEHEEVMEHYAKMMQRTATLLSIPLRRLTIKHAGIASLGLMFRRQALAAQCLATIKYPTDLPE